MVATCIRNRLPAGQLKQDGTRTKHYFQSLLTTKENYNFMHAFIIFM